MWLPISLVFLLGLCAPLAASACEEQNASAGTQIQEIAKARDVKQTEQVAQPAETAIVEKSQIQQVNFTEKLPDTRQQDNGK